MSSPVDGGKQGAAGELRGKSLGELAEILERQEKLLSNKKFIAKLPDRGKKILEYTEKIRSAIAEHKRQKQKTDRLSAFKLQFQEQQRNIRENVKALEEPDDKVRHVPTTVTEGKEPSSDQANETKSARNQDISSSPASLNTREETCNSHTDENSADVLANSLKFISIKDSGDEAKQSSSDTSAEYKEVSSSPGTSGTKKSHYIEVLERRSESPVQRKERFKTNRLPSDSNSSTPNQSPGDKVLRMSAEQRKLQDRKHLDDITAARLPPLHHSPAQLLPLEESLELQMAQKKIYEEKQAKLAAQKLFEKLNIKMGAFNPEGDSYMKYRDRGDYVE
ncbi:hypothetical protein GDO81_009681 [Engystomops pustulosus]|uniref:DNA-directed RNA polymerase II subunit GRINL1A n=1 Tax=Engystomops pustulosus TaxID=76066 RepID=A0AAV7BTT0_ENGPU|nr:hypothetical protein GDO81_009681 [Engystomops pustulosus]